MTVTEFYEWAKENGVEDYEIVVTECSCGYFETKTPEESADINHATEQIEL